ncbi:SRPBCC family protein [Hoyosella rhizosphaerae]|uniref:SRPBCC family protein n=1 Tax=Hoyosella rhizosphaerae TaxID=1755582 RepID=A0A916X8T1_9ACTN|nr:SRPBCC family protein [Hoyosella rhizosphaerae]MBN4927253.1 SRPBCC family protein [Hoyosella rhizosphaerae]GGC52743.1 hypothetical protein GCM10011410_01330 [Hoyosella rhizosphaerae]
MIRNQPTTTPLRRTLLTNAAFSLGSAVVLIAAPTLVNELLGINAPRSVYLVVGIGLAIFAADLIHQGTRPRIAVWRSLYSSAADFAWVLATVVALALFGGALSTSGRATIVVVAAVVLGLGIAQLWGVHRASFAAGVHKHRISVETTAPMEKMWPVVRDIGSIARYMPSLASSEVIDNKEPGVGAVRQCVNRAGKGWSEECTTFDPSGSFALRFRSEDENFPFPASAMAGGWAVNEGPAKYGSTVTVWWELTPHPRWLSLLILPALAKQVDREIPRVISRMAVAATGRATVVR